MSADRSTLAVCVDVLGPLTLRVQGRAVEVPGLRRRALLALLALASGRPRRHGAAGGVAVAGRADRTNAAQALYNHVSRIRGHLGPRGDRLERRGDGYRLRLEPDELDADTARRLAGAAARADADVAATDRARWRSGAGRRWRSSGRMPAIEVERVGLDELRRRLVDDLLEERLTLGDRGVTARARRRGSGAAAGTHALLHVRALADGRSDRRGDGGSTGASDGGWPRRRARPGPPGRAGATGRGGRARRPAAPSGTGRGGVAPGGSDGRERARPRGGESVCWARNATVTITGTGGVGKTRLALDVAADPEAVPGAEVVVVDLAAVDRAGTRVRRRSPRRSACAPAAEVGQEEVASALADGELLLVLDNCEHLVDACRELVAAVRRSAPDVRVLATSRVTLRAPGEYVVRLQPLAVPRDAVGPRRRCADSPGCARSSSTPPTTEPDFDAGRGRRRRTWSRCCAASTGCRSASSSRRARWR